MAFSSDNTNRFSPSSLVNSPIEPYYFDIDDQLRQYVYSVSMEAIEAGQKARARVSSQEEAESRKKSIRETFLSCIGGLPQDCPLEAEITRTIQCRGFHIENIVFQARFKEYVTANLYMPDGLVSPSGAVLFLCGHFDEAKQAPEYQIACQHLVQAGLIVLAVDPIGQGERYAYCDKETGKSAIVREGSYAHDYQGAQCLLTGRSIASYFVHDAMRAIDYLCTRSEVDPSRIGVTGNSGGGTQTAMMMMADPRIAAAAPATYITSRNRYMPLGEAQCMEQVWPGFTAAGMDYADMLIAMAPKPVLVLASLNDFFPIEGTRESFAEAKEIYLLYGQEHNLSLFEQDCSHQYSEAMAIKAAEFFNRHLNHRNALPKSYAVEPLEPSRLSCTVSGQVLKEYVDCRTVFDDNRDILDGLKEKRCRTANEGLRWLRDRVFMNRRKCPTQLRCIDETEVDGLLLRHLLWWSQKGVFNYGVLFEKKKHEGNKLPLTIALWDGGTKSMDQHSDWIRNVCERGNRVLVLDVSGAGSLLPRHNLSAYNRGDDKGFGYQMGYRIALCLIWLGDSLPFLRTYDLIRSIDALNETDWAESIGVKVYGWGRAGLYAELASLTDNRIESCTWENGFTFDELASSKMFPFEGSMEIIIPGILEHMDFRGNR